LLCLPAAGDGVWRAGGGPDAAPLSPGAWKETLRTPPEPASAGVGVGLKRSGFASGRVVRRGGGGGGTKKY
jgi:hypothetical protein